MHIIRSENSGFLFQKLIFLVLFTFSLADGSAQKIENVYPDIAGEKIHIYYDLLDIEAFESVNVKVFMSTDGGKTYGESLVSVTGDVGLVTGPGEGKCIIWDVFRDIDELVSVNVKFKVRADPVRTELIVHSAKKPVKLGLNTNLGNKLALNSSSFGINAKGIVYLNQLGLGLRGDIYKTFRKDINYSEMSTVYPDTGYYWGYSAGAVLEYDFIKKKKYSLYPFLYVGQSKLIYKYNTDYKDQEYFRYTVFGSLGLGADIRFYKFLYLGIEIEYLLSPWIDLIPSESLDESLDGFNFGFVLRFVLNPD